MIAHVALHRIGRQDGVERFRLAAGLGEVQMRHEGIAAEGIAGEEEVHVLQMAVEARRHVDAVDHAEAVAEAGQRLDQFGGEGAARHCLPDQASGSLPR